MSRKMSEQQQQEAPETEMEREMEYHFKLEVEALDLSSDLSPKSPVGTQTDKTTEMEFTQDIQRTGTDKWPNMFYQNLGALGLDGEGSHK